MLVGTLNAKDAITKRHASCRNHIQYYISVEKSQKNFDKKNMIELISKYYCEKSMSKERTAGVWCIYLIYQ